MIIRWRYADTPDTKHNTWQGRSLFRANDRFARYWFVSLVQTSPADVIFRARNDGANAPAMNQIGNTIWVNADFRWGSSATAREQMMLTAIHEIGHWLSRDRNHAPVGSVMAPVVGDPYINWTLSDMQWFRRLPWRSSLRPWHPAEVNRWRPIRASMMLRQMFLGEETYQEIPLCGKGVGHV